MAPGSESGPRPGTVEVMGSPNPKTFCSLPFKHFCVGAEGTVRLCCVTPDLVSEHGSPMSLLSSPMEDIWNSAYMRNIRRAMLQGESISACEVCYESEAASGQSYRTVYGLEPVVGTKLTPEELMAYGARTGYRVEEWPPFIKLEISNLCNLKCRMCYGGNSSQIERDPVHSRWAGGADPMHALWRGTYARIGPEPRIGVRSSGLFPLEEVGNNTHRRWTDGHAVFNVPLRPDTKLERLDVEFHEGGPFGQNFQILVNGRRRAGGVLDPAKRRVSVDLSKLDHKGRLVVEIPSSRLIDKPGQKERGVPLRQSSCTVATRTWSPIRRSSARRRSTRRGTSTTTSCSATCCARPTRCGACTSPAASRSSTSASRRSSIT